MVKKSVNEMSFLDHVEDLRWHLIRIISAILLTAMVAFVFKNYIFDVILLGPKKITFPTYQWLCNVSKNLGIENSSFCGEDFPFKIQSRTMAGQFSAHIWTSIYAGFILSFPYTLYQLWQFISPGLLENERKHSRFFLITSSILFFLGVLFGYYIICPLSIHFLGTYSVSSQIHNDFDLASYIGLVRASVIASGIIFELPILIYFLTRVGLITPEFLIKYRKYALVIVLIIAAIITPPDIASQIIVAIPILILYQISIYISKMVVRNAERKERKLAKKSS